MALPTDMKAFIELVSGKPLADFHREIISILQRPDFDRMRFIQATRCRGKRIMDKPYLCLTKVEPGETCTLCGGTHEEHERRMAEWTPPPIDDEYREKVIASLR